MRATRAGTVLLLLMIACCCGVVSSLDVQVVSDLHLEFDYNEKHFELFPVRAKVLMLLGDVANPNPYVNTTTGSSKDVVNHGVYEKFIGYVSSRYTTVLVLLGNHEFFNNEVTTTKEIVQKLFAMYKNVYLMDRSVVLLDPESAQVVTARSNETVTILGTTLWSHVPDGSIEAVSRVLKEYRAVHVVDSVTKEQRLIKVNDTNGFNEIEFKWLNSEIQNSVTSGYNVVVATHHAPVFENTNNPIWVNSEITCGFSNNLTDYIQRNPRIRTWIYGHTHWNSDFYIGKTRVVSNQMGYLWKPDEQNQPQPFNHTFIIQL